MKTLHATWELDNIGVDAYELTLGEQDAPQAVAQEEARLAALGAQYLVVKTPVDCPALLFGLPGLGYTFVETVFHVAMERAAYHMPEVVARFDRGLSVIERADERDVSRVCDLIRAGVFKSDRVSVDPAFSLALGGRRYAGWLRQMLGRGARLYEMLCGERPVGFFVIERRDERTVDPVLMGLYDEGRDRGMGALLHKKTLDTCFTLPCDRLASTVVSNNRKVLRVYVNAGASVEDMLYTYVKHIG